MQAVGRTLRCHREAPGAACDVAIRGKMRCSAKETEYPLSEVAEVEQRGEPTALRGRVCPRFIAWRRYSLFSLTFEKIQTTMNAVMIGGKMFTEL